MNSLKELFRFLKPYRATLVTAFILTLLVPYFTVWNPILISKVIDEGFVQKSAELVWAYGLVFLFSQIMIFFFSTFLSYALSAFGLQILVDYRSDLLKKILSYPISFFDRMHSGQITTRLTNDVNSLQELFSTAVVALLGSAFLIVGVMIGMLIVDWKMALVSFLSIPGLIWLTVVLHSRMRRRFSFVRKATSALNSFSGESFSGSRDIQVLAAARQMQNEFDLKSLKLNTRWLAVGREFAIYNSTVPFFTALMMILILSYGGYRVAAGEIRVGELVAFLTYANYFSQPIRDFAEKYTVFQQAMSAIDRLTELTQQKPEENPGQEAFSGFQKIELRDVVLQYPATESPALVDVNFEVTRGQKVALIGETGSGKTSTCSLLLRFYPLKSGVILMDGKSIDHFDLHSYRQQVAWVSQEVVLLSTTLRENIRFFDSEISDDQIWEVLEWVQLASWARALPRGLDELFSERASTLSSGQRQLISLARALVRRPKMLILDEATSYVDAQTEFLLQEALFRVWDQPEFKELTGFFIAHRLSTIRRCDRILVFREGRLVESGQWNELLLRKGVAANLYEHQFQKGVA